MFRKKLLSNRILVLLPILLPTTGMALSAGMIRGPGECTVMITSCPTTQPTLLADDDCMVIIPNLVNSTTAESMGLCEGNPTITQSPLAGSSFQVLNGATSIEVVITAEACPDTGKTAETVEGDCVTAMCTVDIAVQLPDLLEDCPAALELTTGPDCMAVVPGLQVPKNDCAAQGVTTVMQSPTEGSLLGIGMHTISLTLLDGGEPVGECDVDVTVTGPDIVGIVSCTTQPAALEADENCMVTVPDLRGAVDFDRGCVDCELTVTQSPMENTMVPASSSSLLVTLTAECCNGVARGDGCFTDKCEVSVDVILPEEQVQCLASVTSVAADENCEARVPDLRSQAMVVESCPPLLSRGGGSFIRKTQNPAPDTIVGVGETEITILVERCFGEEPGVRGNGEECDELGTCVITLIVYDNGFAFQCPTTQPAMQANPDCTLTIPDLTEQVVVEEDCPGFGTVIISQFPEPGSSYPAFSNPIPVTIFIQKCTDIFGDTRSSEVFCSDLFRCPVDIPINPIQSCPTTPQTIVADANCQATVPDLIGDVQLLDCCDFDFEEARGLRDCELRRTQTPAAGTVIGLGETVVTITVERCLLEFPKGRGIDEGEGEECTLVGSCEVTLNVVDQTPPVITNCPDGPITLSFNANCELEIPTFTATDNCTDDVNIALTTTADSISVTFDQEADALNVTINGQTTTIPLADLRTDPTTALGTISVVVTATDEAGNSSTCEATATVLIGDCPVPDPQVPPPQCQGAESYNILISLLYRAPVCSPCPITIAMGISGIVFLRSGHRRRRRNRRIR